MAKIKFRTTSGKLFNLKDAAFVEICDNTDKLACLVYISDNGTVFTCLPGDDKFKRYVRMYKKEVSTIINE